MPSAQTNGTSQHSDKPVATNGTTTNADVNGDDGGWTEVIYKHGADQEEGKPRKIPRPIYRRPKKAYALKPEYKNTFGTSFRDEKPAAPASTRNSSAGSAPRANGERRPRAPKNGNETGAGADRRYQGQGYRQVREHDPARVPGWYERPAWDVRPKRESQGQAKREAKKAQPVKAKKEQDDDFSGAI